MTRKIIGTVLLAVGGLFIIVLVFGGGPIFPHIAGPGTLAIVGALLLTIRRKSGDGSQKDMRKE